MQSDIFPALPNGCPTKTSDSIGGVRCGECGGAGDYWLEITTQYSNGSVQTKEPRTLRFGKVLNVPAAEPAPDSTLN